MHEADLGKSELLELKLKSALATGIAKMTGDFTKPVGLPGPGPQKGPPALEVLGGVRASSAVGMAIVS